MDDSVKSKRSWTGESSIRDLSNVNKSSLRQLSRSHIPQTQRVYAKEDFGSKEISGSGEANENKMSSENVASIGSKEVVGSRKSRESKGSYVIKEPSGRVISGSLDPYGSKETIRSRGTSKKIISTGSRELTSESKEVISSMEITSAEEKKQFFGAEKKTNLSQFLILGLYSAYVCLTYEFILLATTSNLIYMVFGGAAADVVGCGNTTIIPKIEGTGKLVEDEKCAILESLMLETNCTPILKAQFESVNYEFQYFCSRASYVKTTTAVQMVGLMLGAMIFGQISDFLGRRMALLLGIGGLILFHAGSSFAFNLLSFTILRFFVMLFAGGAHGVGYVFMMESLPMRHRVWIITMVNPSPNYIIIATIAYFTGNWRFFSRILSSVSSIAFFLLIFVQEPAIWSLNKERFDAARECMIQISMVDGTFSNQRNYELDYVLDKEKARLAKIREQGAIRRRYNTFHLFSTVKFAIYTIFFAYSVMITSAINYGVMFNFEKLSGSIFMNCGTVGAIRYIINIIMGFADFKFIWAGRRLLHTFCMFAMFGCLLTNTSIIALGYIKQMATFCRFIALLAASICTELYVLNAVTPAELFPTPIRNAALGFIQAFNRIGNIIAPYMFIMGKIWLPLPYAVMATLCLIDATAYLLFIPETKGKPLPERMPWEEESARADAETGKEKVSNTSVPTHPESSERPSKSSSRP